MHGSSLLGGRDESGGELVAVTPTMGGGVATVTRAFWRTRERGGGSPHSAELESTERALACWTDTGCLLMTQPGAHPSHAVVTRQGCG